MNAKDLRIGNLVQGIRIGKVKSIYSTHFQVDDFDCISLGNSMQEQFKPIPITEDWLLKFGFEVDKMSKWGGWLSPRFDLGSQIRIRDCSDYFKMQIAKIKYIHQLQNLYFALTEKELEVK